MICGPKGWIFIYQPENLKFHELSLLELQIFLLQHQQFMAHPYFLKMRHLFLHKYQRKSAIGKRKGILVKLHQPLNDETLGQSQQF